jgi:hypothetical protein
MAKGRSGPTVYEKQQSVIDGFAREIRSEKYRTQLNATEQCIQQGLRNKAYLEKLQSQPSKPYISVNSQDSPLRGSNGWNEAQWETYKLWLKNKKREDKLNANK